MAEDPAPYPYPPCPCCVEFFTYASGRRGFVSDIPTARTNAAYSKPGPKIDNRERKPKTGAG